MLNVKLIQKIVGKLDTDTKYKEFKNQLDDVLDGTDWGDGDLYSLTSTCSMAELTTQTDEKYLALNIVAALMNGYKAIISNVTDSHAATLLKKFGFKHVMTYRGNHGKDVMCFSINLSKYCY